MAKAKEAARVKDANDQLREWKRKGVKPEEQIRKVETWLKGAEPFIVFWANQVGEIQNLSEKTEALNEFFRDGVARLSNEDRAGFREAVCEALQIRSTQWSDRLKNIDGQKRKKGKDEDEEAIFTTGGWTFEHLLGLEYEPETDRTFLAVKYPDGHVEDHVERVVIQGKPYRPIQPNTILRKRMILLPTQLTELKTEKELLFAIKAHNRKYVDMGTDATFEQLITIYPFYTYLAGQFRTVPYLRMLGDYGTGKSRVLKTIGPLCYQAIMTNAGSSAASLFRILDIYLESTLVLDEADFGDSDEASMIGKILNGGNEKGSAILRTAKDADGNFDPTAYEVFGPKILGMRKNFQDQAIESRCLTKMMLPIQPRPEIPLDLPPIEEYERECVGIRNALFTYRMHHLQRDCQVDLKSVDRNMDARTAQVTLSLLTVMKTEEGRDLVRGYLKAVTEERKSDRYEMYTARVLEGIILAWAWGPVSDRLEDKQRVYLKDIAAATNMVIDEQNRQMGELDEESDEHEGIDKKTGKKIFKTKSRKVSDVMKKYLSLTTKRATDGMPDYKGTKYVDMDLELERIRGLCERWGVEWKESGSQARPQSVQIDFMKSSPGIRKLREEWQESTPKEPDAPPESEEQ